MIFSKTFSLYSISSVCKKPRVATRGFLPFVLKFAPAYPHRRRSTDLGVSLTFRFYYRDSRENNKGPDDLPCSNRFMQDTRRNQYGNQRYGVHIDHHSRRADLADTVIPSDKTVNRYGDGRIEKGCPRHDMPMPRGYRELMDIHQEKSKNSHNG
jgi:hypothetical protein